MLFEKASIYIYLLLLILFFVYLTVKICLSKIFKTNNVEPWKAFVPIYCKYELIKLLGLDTKMFFKTLIPIINLYYFNIIIKKLLEVTSNDPVESIWYLIFPMYKFPELILRRSLSLNNKKSEKLVVSNDVDILDLTKSSPDNINIETTTYIKKETKKEDPDNILSYIDNTNNTLQKNTSIKEAYKNCPNCTAVIPRDSDMCSFCGYYFE